MGVERKELVDTHSIRWTNTSLTRITAISVQKRGTFLYASATKCSWELFKVSKHGSKLAPSLFSPMVFNLSSISLDVFHPVSSTHSGCPQEKRFLLERLDSLPALLCTAALHNACPNENNLGSAYGKSPAECHIEVERVLVGIANLWHNDIYFLSQLRKSAT